MEEQDPPLEFCAMPEHIAEIPESEYADHFDSLGSLDLSGEDGSKLAITMFMCHDCGSVIAARALHYAIHQDLVYKPNTSHEL